MIKTGLYIVTLRVYSAYTRLFAENYLIMKIFPVVFVTFFLFLVTLEVNARNLASESGLLKKRRLLGEPAGFGEKINSETSNPDTKTGNEAKNDDADDDNPSYNNFGQPSGSSTETHHYFTDDRKPRRG
ncbi:hypothetical protein K2173_008085 [Erythroxylum novogranatense]|uniref:Uncharacterized protein n=1 Tax=Erythroxylum novogranatense TaxID=1862640 RepID=A0AAV8S9B3_9ROSI|nr:hypothetical protein K2173_008085 [Erythroxylum novogranatense]